MRTTGTLRDLESGGYVHYKTAADAIVAGILDVQRSGGGVVWIHRPECGDNSDTDFGCLCNPVPVHVEASLPN